MAWCGHTTLIADCNRCKLVRTRADYREVWGIALLPDGGVGPSPLPKHGIDPNKPRMSINDLIKKKRH